MANAGHACDGGIEPLGQLGAKDLSDATSNHGNRNQGQADIVDLHEESERLLPFQIMDLSKEGHKEEEEHAQHKEMGMDLAQGGHSCKAIPFGELPVEKPCQQARNSVDEG